jgi:predicted alpha/beta-fold hydrolase
MSELDTTAGLSRVTQRWTSYRAPWWLPGGHAQTLWRKVAPVPVLRRSRQRQRLELEDGDFIDLDWHHSSQPDAITRPLVILLHGLCGCSTSPYIVCLQDHLDRKGHDSVAMNLRGCSGEPNRLAHSYHSGCSDDLEAVVRSLPADRSLALVGYSLGANVLVKWLGETALQDRVCAAVSVSNPFSLAHCCEVMISGPVSRFYGRYFLRSLQRDVEQKKRWFRRIGEQRELQRLEALGDLGTLEHIRDFDDRVTAPLSGFADADDYYGQCSSDRFIGRVRVPLLVVHSNNDPIIPAASIPELSRAPDNVMWDLHADGGHVGFAVAGHRYWLEQRIGDFLTLT